MKAPLETSSLQFLRPLPRGSSALLVRAPLARFCERVLSAANLIMTDGNTLLDDAELEMLTILRINRNFMEFMRANYNAESRQNFKQTLIDEKAASHLE